MYHCTTNLVFSPHLHCTVFVLRTVVQSHRCQQKELIVGRTSQSVEIYYPTVKVVPNEGNRLRENTFVRMRYRAQAGSDRTLSSSLLQFG